jgi:hypothetical protein
MLAKLDKAKMTFMILKHLAIRALNQFKRFSVSVCYAILRSVKSKKEF